MAERFKFRLETVRRVRERAYQATQRVVAQRLQAIGREQALISAAQWQIEDQLNQARKLRQSSLEVESERNRRAYLGFLNRRIAECRARLVEHQTRLDEERAAMVAARVAKRALDVLKERQAERFQAALARTEAADQAEIALNIYRRQESHLIESPG
jgi:flagellar export protein FliJ